MLTELIKLALRELGICEIPMGSNNVKYNHEYWGERSSYADLPWCVVFLWWLCKQLGIPFPQTAHCNGVEQYAKAKGQWVTSDFKAGDMVIFDYNLDGNRDHIGLVIETDGNSLVTVEGNYGDKVSRVKRKASEVVGAYRPDYLSLETETSDKEEETTPSVADGDSPPCQGRPSEEETATEPVGNSDKLPELKRGDKKPAVGALQVLLRYQHGMKMKNSFTRAGIPDEEFGEETEAALEAITGAKTTTMEVWSKLIGGR